MELTLGWGLGAWRTNHVSRGLELSVSLPDLREGGRERGWRLNQFSVASNLINNAHVMNKNPKDRVSRTSSLTNPGRC